MTQLRNRSKTRLYGVPAMAAGPAVAGVSVDDTTPGFLDAKIVAGTDIALVVLNPGGNEQLEVSSGFSKIVNETGVTITVTNEDIVKSTAAGDITVNLPALSAFDKPVTIFAGAAGDIIIDPDGSETIDDLTTLTIPSGNSNTIFPFTFGWQTI